jgi:hypothetical protein
VSCNSIFHKNMLGLKKIQSKRLQLDEVLVGEVLTFVKSWHIKFLNHIGTTSYIYIQP